MTTQSTTRSPLYQPVIELSVFPHFQRKEIGTNYAGCNQPRHMNSIQFKLGPQRNNRGSVVLGEPIVEGCFDTPPVFARNKHPIPVGSVAGVHLQGHWCQVQHVFDSRWIYSKGICVFLCCNDELSLKLFNIDHSVKLLLNHFSSRSA